MASLRPIVHRLHDPEHDDLGLYTLPVALDPGDTLTTETGLRLRFLAMVEMGEDGAVNQLSSGCLSRVVDSPRTA